MSKTTETPDFAALGRASMFWPSSVWQKAWEALDDKRAWPYVVQEVSWPHGPLASAQFYNKVLSGKSLYADRLRLTFAVDELKKALSAVLSPILNGLADGAEWLANCFKVR